MNNIIESISSSLNIRVEQIEKTLKLLEEGNTIPFISRYRKDVTEGLLEDDIKKISEVYTYECNLAKRREDVKRLIDEKGLLTEDIISSLNNATKLVEIEDIYRPFKEKKKTKATEAIKNGLEPLAKIIMSFKVNNLDDLLSKYITDAVPTKEQALEGAKYIIAEWISDNAYYRKNLRRIIFNNGVIETKLKKNAKDDNKIYEMYYSYSESLKTIKPHRYLAINRGEVEDILSVSIEVDNNLTIKYLEDKVIKENNNIEDIVKDAIKDSYKRLIFPSIEREIRSELKERADEQAIFNFGKNLEALLLQPPIKEKVVLAVDPGYVNGCKLAVVDKTGKYLESTVIKPFASSDSKLEEAKKVLLDLIKKYNVDIISIGNGTASRESEKLVASLIKDNNLTCKFVIVSEAGASIYSTEDIAKEEFPNLSPNERSAVSIARRLQDPLAELVKIPPEGIGVGLYQHDVPQNQLKDRLDFVVEKAVNNVGVNINTASTSILKYISGLTKKSIDKLIDYRNTHGKFKSREELKKELTPKAYEQSIGFLRILDGTNILDGTSIHPESYDVTCKLIDSLGFKLSDIGSSKLNEALDNIKLDEYTKLLNIDSYTLEDIIKSLKKPNRDPREDIPLPILKSDILDSKDLKIGMHLQGTVRNVVDFGAFIDIGLHDDGLVHISKITDKYIKHPSDYLSVGDIVDCYVIDIKDNGKVSLSLLKENV